LLVYGAASLFFIAAWMAREPLALGMLFAAMGMGMVVLALCFHYLTVEDEGERLVIRFGPIPIFRTSIPYGEIHHVELDRTLIIEGWGIHGSVRGGSVWNLWGRDCVVVHRRRGDIRIGTDDPDGLARFLESKMAELER
jgi:hypothetical protein